MSSISVRRFETPDEKREFESGRFGDTERFEAPPKLIGFGEQEAIAIRLRAALTAA